MLLFFKKRQLFHLFFISSILSLNLSCREKADSSSALDMSISQTDMANQPTNEELLAQKAIIFGQVLDQSGVALEQVSLKVDGFTATTDQQGLFQFEVNPLSQKILEVKKSGYLTQRHTISIELGTQLSLDLKLWPQGEPQLLNADMGGELQGELGAQITLPPLGLINAQGDLVAGMVEVYLTPLSASDPNALTALSNRLIAEQKSGDTTLLESFGMLEITVMQGDEELNIAPGKMMDIRIPASQREGQVLPQQTALWSFNEERNIWIEEGMMTLDPQTNTYQAPIPHLSAWNADQPSLAGCMCGQVVDEENNEPIAGAQITARGLSYDGVTDAIAQQDGKFCINVRVSSSIQIIAQHALGGGLEKSFMSSDQVSSVPPTQTDVCVDLGILKVKKKVMIIEDQNGQQTTIACSDKNPFEGNQVADCFKNFKGFNDCFIPVGNCQNILNDGNSYLTRYANGAEVKMLFSEQENQENQVSYTYEFYSADQILCYRTLMSYDQNTYQITYTYIDANNQEIKMTYQTNGDIKWSCASGESFVITQAQQDEFKICNPSELGIEGQNNSSCNETIFDACQQDGGCGENQLCCEVNQMENGNTSIYRTCTDDQASCDTLRENF